MQQLDPPPVNTSMFDQNGNLSVQWQFWFNSLWEKINEIIGSLP